MESLPPELVCFILSKLDGHSLAHASCVCHRWHGLVKILGCRLNIWFSRCVQEIGVESVVEWTGKTKLLTSKGITSAKARKDEWEYWKHLYAQYFRCRLLGHWSMVKHSIALPFSAQNQNDLAICKITALGITDENIIVTCHKNGSVFSRQGFHLQEDIKDSLQGYQILPSHHHVVLGVAFVTTGGQKKATLIVTVGFDGHVKISSMDGVCLVDFRPSSKQVNSVSAFGEYFTVGTHASMVTGVQVFRVTWEENQLAVNIAITLSGLMYSEVCAVALSNNKVSAGDLHGVLYQWAIPALTSFVVNKRSAKYSTDDEVICVKEPNFAFQLKSSIQQILICKNYLCVLLADYTVELINDEDVIVMALSATLLDFSRLYSEPICLARRGPLLAVGCQNGTVLLFNTESREWWKNMKQNLMCMIHTKVGHVTSLVITDDGKGTVVIAGGEMIEVFAWRNPRSFLTSQMEAMYLQA